MSAWGILESIIGSVIVQYVFPVMGGLIMFLWVKHKESLWKASLAGLISCTCLLVITNMLASKYIEISKNPTALIYEEIIIPTDKAIGLNISTINELSAKYGDNISGWVDVQGSAIAYRIDGGTPTTKTAQKIYPGSILYLTSPSSLRNFRAIALEPGRQATIAINYCKGHVR